MQKDSKKMSNEDSTRHDANIKRSKTTTQRHNTTSNCHTHTKKINQTEDLQNTKNNIGAA